MNNNISKKDFYLIIAGSRTFFDYDILNKITTQMLINHLQDNIHIIAGEAKGADTLAKKYAYDNGYQYHAFPADWNSYGKVAGYKRNRQMHEFAAQYPYRGCLCFWDGMSKGTSHNFKLSKKYNTPLRVYNYILHSYVNPVS